MSTVLGNGNPILSDLEASSLFYFDYDDDNPTTAASNSKKNVDSDGLPSSPSTETEGEEATLVLPLPAASSNAVVLGRDEDDALSSVLAALGARRSGLVGKQAVLAEANEILAANNTEDLSLFYIYDLGLLARLHQAWCARMPRVSPFYA
eukprot:scaffold313347_cov30-Prasinocladus_malaysianus.AAC.1